MKLKTLNKIFLLSLVCLCNLIAQTANNKVSGRVTVAGTGEPLIGVNVYLNNSTIGTATNKEGFYILYLPAGRFEIVVSIVGFQPESRSIYVKNNSESKIDFALKEKVYEIDQVLVENRFPDEWYKKLNLFKMYLLGQNDFSPFCRIENEKDIYFSGDDNFIFKVHSYNPLIIRNDALGYLMECIIIKFEIDHKNIYCVYSLKTRFTDLSDLEPAKKVNWIENRRIAYVGSLRHFLFTAITKNNLEGFNVSLVKTTDYKEKGISVKNGTEIIKAIGENPDYLLSFNGFLRIKYRYSIDSSWLKISENNSYINYNGCLVNPLSVTQYGRWAFDGLSKSLPMDYISF